MELEIQRTIRDRGVRVIAARQKEKRERQRSERDRAAKENR